MNILITGTSGYLGQAVIRRIIHNNPFGRVFGMDRRPPKLLGPVRFILKDLGDMEVDEIGELMVTYDIECVLNLVFGNSARSKTGVKATQVLLEAAGMTGVRRLVQMSGYDVYATGHMFDTTPRKESDPVWGEGVAPRHAERRLEVERRLWRTAEIYPRLEVVALRCCHVIGPGLNSRVDALLDSPVIFGRKGREPVVQFLHIEDAAEALIRGVLVEGLMGPVNVAGTDAVPLSVMAGILEKRVVRLSPWMARSALELGNRAGRLKFGPGEWERLVDSAPLDVSMLPKALGYTPRYTTRQTLALWRTGYVDPPPRYMNPGRAMGEG